MWFRKIAASASTSSRSVVLLGRHSWADVIAYMSTSSFSMNGMKLALSLILAGVAAASLNVAKSALSSKTKAQQQAYPVQEIAQASSDRDKFQVLYPMLRHQILDHLRENEMPEEALEWCREMMDYNVPGGKLNRGTTVVAVLRAMKQRELTPEEVAKAAVLGWAIEFLQAFFLVADDVMDDSQTRRGQPCWYQLPKVRMIAINDSFLLESFVFYIIKEHFGDEPYYHRLVELMLNVIQKTEIGQLLDLTSQPMGANAVDLDRFTLQRYKRIVKYKTAFYTFYLPIAMGMIISGMQQQSDYDLAETICCNMGEYFQIQDDYLDCYGDPSVIGKVGTDIQDNKCSWLVVQALQRCSPAQRQVLEENYGCWDDTKVAAIKQLYQDLNLSQVFSDYEENSYKEIQSELDKVKSMPREVFEVLLHKIYKRSK